MASKIVQAAEKLSNLVRCRPDETSNTVHVFVDGEHVHNKHRRGFPTVIDGQWGTLFLTVQTNADGVMVGLIIHGAFSLDANQWLDCQCRWDLPPHLREVADRWFLEHWRLQRVTERNRAYFRAATTAGNGNGLPPHRFFELQTVSQRGPRRKYVVRQNIRRARQ